MPPYLPARQVFGCPEYLELNFETIALLFFKNLPCNQTLLLILTDDRKN